VIAVPSAVAGQLTARAHYIGRSHPHLAAAPEHAACSRTLVNTVIPGVAADSIQAVSGFCPYHRAQLPGDGHLQRLAVRRGIEHIVLTVVIPDLHPLCPSHIHRVLSGPPFSPADQVQ
jgi:hypothetical protein